MHPPKAIWSQFIKDKVEKAISFLSNNYLSVMETIGCLIEFRDYHDGNVNESAGGIGDNRNTNEKCNVVSDGKLEKREYLFWLENDTSGNSAIQPQRIRNLMEQPVGVYYNNINDLKNRCITWCGCNNNNKNNSTISTCTKTIYCLV